MVRVTRTIRGPCAAFALALPRASLIWARIFRRNYVKYPIYSINCYSIRPWMMECDATPNVPGIAIFTLTKKNDKKRSFFQKTETWDQSKVETCDSQCNGLQAQSTAAPRSEVPLTRPAARGLRVAF